MSEPTVTVTQDPCPTCQGDRRVQTGEMLNKTGFRRSEVVPQYATCGTCAGAGKLVSAVPLSALARLTEDPDEFARSYGSDR